MKSFPDNCIRGLRERKFLTEDGKIAAAAYIPDFRTAANRADGGSEASINWEDDENVLAFTLRDRAVAEWGAGRLPRREIDHLNNQPGSLNALIYERKVENNNPYHGNIVFRQNLPRPLITMIAGSLALASEPFPAVR